MPRFDACPADSQTCVSTLNDAGYPALDPIPFSGSPEDALAAVTAVIGQHARTEIVETDGLYVKSVFKTRVIGFKDTVQFQVDAEANVIHFRSESVPYAGNDLGANRKRMKKVSDMLRSELG